MRNILLSALLVAALALSACESNDSVTDPVSTTGETSTLLRAVENLDLSDAQLAQIDEMYLLGEDLSILLDDNQLNELNTLISAMDGTFDARGHRGHFGFDMGALVYLRLIIQANPDLDDATREALLELIKNSNATRLQIISDYKDDPETMKTMLQAEHDALIAAMTALLTTEQIDNVETLKAELEQLREERRALWVAQRVERLVLFYTEKLGLTQEQADSIKVILENQYAKIEELRAQYAGDPEALRTALESLAEDTNAAIEALLTTEQLTIWEEMRKAPIRWRPGHHHRR
ncbi:hypothetical protein KQI65_00610 [bacterium]|nr:hypothetical protein [bacterium]